jgi:hypothetical protein
MLPAACPAVQWQSKYILSLPGIVAGDVAVRFVLKYPLGYYLARGWRLANGQNRAAGRG